MRQVLRRCYCDGFNMPQPCLLAFVARVADPHDATVYGPKVFRDNFPLAAILRKKELNQLCGACYFSLGCTISIALFPPAIVGTEESKREKYDRKRTRTNREHCSHAPVAPLLPTRMGQAIASIVCLIIGDMSAALVGVAFGGEVAVVKLGRAGKKSLEGSAAMFFVCFIFCCIIFHGAVGFERSESWP